MKIKTLPERGEALPITFTESDYVSFTDALNAMFNFYAEEYKNKLASNESPEFFIYDVMRENFPFVFQSTDIRFFLPEPPKYATYPYTVNMTIEQIKEAQRLYSIILENNLKVRGAQEVKNNIDNILNKI